MPRIYLTATELNEHPMGIGLAAQLSQLPTGSIDKLLARASQRCDSYCRKRLQAPGSSTLSSAASAGASTIAVTGTLTLDNLAEQAVVLNPGAGNQETVLIQSGGVTVTSWASPYPGTIKLDQALVYNHSQNEPVQYCYKEVSEAGSSSTSDPYTEAMQTQAMQIALAHLPPARQALTRVVFLKNYPIISISQIEHAFSFTNQFNAVDMTIETIEPTQGWYRFNVATVILREGMMRTTYTGGYQTIPDDIKIATTYYLADELSMMSNPFGATRLTLGKKTTEWRRPSGSSADSGKTPAVSAAEEALKPYRRSV